ncbi:c-type cytochrome [Pseudomonas sp. NPDC086278]|uniref:c-type cytochrome n=1 Tax=Pseudomonas sp. NPDC086278 TaxID=3390646 RepID=UPI003D083B99
MPISRAIALLGMSLVAQANALGSPPDVQVCIACHGAKGEGTLQGPMLAGLSELYISAQIENFIAGRRSNAVMSAVAQGYSDVKLRNQVAGYFAGQGTTPTLHLRGEQIEPTLASQLYYQGDLGRDLPACYSCHGPSAIGTGPFPRLAGQQAAYLKEQLMAWKNRQRSGDPDDMMGNIARKLSTDEIDVLSGYLSGIR